MVDVSTENARRGVVNELLYVDDLVFMSEDLKERPLYCSTVLKRVWA